MKIINREHWLTEFINLLSPIFSEHGYTLPKFRVSCSLPSSRAAQGNKSQTIGECWASCASFLYLSSSWGALPRARLSIRLELLPPPP